MSDNNATPAPKMTLSRLYESIEQFIHDNRHSTHAETRWLCDYLAGDPLLRVRTIRNGTKDDDLLARVSEFRAGEIKDEIERREREIADFQRELKKIKAA